MRRGDRREGIFLNEVDRNDFWRTLAEACEKAEWQVQACCLMRQYFHLVLETPHGNLVAGRRWLLSTYTIRLNHRHKQGLRRGGFGGEGFRQRMIERMADRLGAHHAGELRQESAETKAREILGQELKQRGWTRSDLKRRRKSDPEKLAIAARLRAETTLTIKRIADLTGLGTSKGAHTNLHRWMLDHELELVPGWAPGRSMKPPRPAIMIMASRPG